MNSVIAIDGPAGSGKSTVARIVAEKMGYVHADSGAIYRSITLALMEERGMGESDKEFGEILKSAPVDFTSLGITIDFENDRQVNRIKGVDVNERIRTREVTSRIRYIADSIDARYEVNRLLREFAEKTPLVADGRDIVTVVFPETPFKFFLTASPSVRANRRYNDMVRNGETLIPVELLEKEIEKRDKDDENRPFGALKKADDAILIDTSGDTANVVAGFLLSHLQIQF
jgi:CMP/dCMP kinase